MSAGSVKTTPKLVEPRVGRPSNPTPMLLTRPAPPIEGKWLLYQLPGWIHDDNVKACLSCGTKFSLWNRRVRLLSSWRPTFLFRPLSLITSCLTRYTSTFRLLVFLFISIASLPRMWWYVKFINLDSYSYTLNCLLPGLY